MNRAHIGLGANLGDPPAQIRVALTALGALGRVLAVSPFYRTPPMGPADQPDFCNAVAIVQSELSPQALMQALLDIERAAGRVRGAKWGPRVLDLDLLHVDGVELMTPELTLPHPGIADRSFVLKPWADIAPTAVVPGVGCIGDLASKLGAVDITLW
ncbi:2-amino-4-hydroxy-6-hydroxymethyldihydropteridine diphosphokinase [Sinimarinibacterium sp. CAU 1509]|uniref:2-amino-4-hydroxy-6- hydroxymethyldihydropteridine diphosphokinase n=1 Tax=Sinimarinibacterium sp. CAU 1509 TaxID=2562283 RepID=UPI0010AC0819|nr:2-amino-4-hydroxy-6-hydroxymethyldihydropteridine diphosphokinase [Sinimarinibacterium sp. CAU 1509]TJY60937.1 2-amino-4-hydroxy-6-hydroxymethyldihydropteridine diphosphokinase [Sinimarinibacterium sp. CAU 1509]